MRRYVRDRMASYWIVVAKGNAELFDLLSVAFKGRSDFSVIVDRRGTEQEPAGGDRRGAGPELGPDEFVVAERAEPFERQVPHATRAGRQATRARRRPRRGVERSRAARVARATASRSPSSADYRLFSL
jgi:hypothetical protein